MKRCYLGKKFALMVEYSMIMDGVVVSTKARGDQKWSELGTKNKVKEDPALLRLVRGDKKEAILHLKSPDEYKSTIATYIAKAEHVPFRKTKDY